MRPRFADAALLLILGAFAFLHFHRMGELSFTWDEGSDLTIVQCLTQTRDPFACRDDITQTRFPFYLHTLAGLPRPGLAPHFVVSFAFSALTLLAVYAYARREYGVLAATLFAALYATAPAILGGGRMVLTHSHIICTAFSTLSFLALFEYNRTRRRAWLHACAVLTGLAGASSILAVFNVVVLLAFLECGDRSRRFPSELAAAVPLRGKAATKVAALQISIAVLTFFAATIIYVDSANLRELVAATLAGGGKYAHWNYLDLNTIRAPWFFPLLLLAIKVGPWLLGLLFAPKRFAIALLVVLLLKGAVFGYETPHHQLQFYPLLYLFIAVGIARVWRPAVAAIAAALFALQLYEVVRFFPNYLFYGAQYGERFMGEFYGPAVVHAQGRDAILREVEKLGDVPVLVADNNAFDLTGPNIVPFTKRDPNVRYEYALVDWLYAEHFHYPERDAYNHYLAAHYREQYTTWFPTRKWVYRLMRRSD